MNAEKGHSQSADNSQLLAHKSSPQGGHAFKLKAPYKPTGDQPQAITELVKGFKEGNQFQTLLGVTGSGKTFTMAKNKWTRWIHYNGEQNSSKKVVKLIHGKY